MPGALLAPSPRGGGRGKRFAPAQAGIVAERPEARFQPPVMSYAGIQFLAAE
jgi:hypothetical protein